jgi:enoyl-CoA hydratase
VIEIVRRGSVAILTMAHGKANAFDVEFSEALIRTLDDCAMSDAGAVVITASGAIFSAGVDLIRIRDGGASYVRSFLPIMCRAFETVFAFPKPLVAAVNGHAFAGGCVLACAADRRIMASGSGRIGVPELLVGVPFPTIAFEIVRNIVPPAHLESLIYTGETFVAADALARGLVDVVVDAGRLVDEAVAAANALASLPPRAFAVTKQQLRGPALQRIREGKGRFDPAIQHMWESPETLEAIGRYVDRTLIQRERGR